VVFQGLGLPYSIAFEHCPLSSDCAFDVWHEEKLGKLTPGNLHALEKKIFIWESVLGSWQLLASLRAEAQAGIIASLWESFCTMEDLV